MQLQQAREKLARHGLSEEARNWVIKALDPACALESSGIPDASNCNVMRPEFTVTTTISPPSGFAAAAWDCMLVFPPGNVVAAQYVIGPAGTNFADSAAPNTTAGNITLQYSADVGGSSIWSALAPEAVGQPNRLAYACPSPWR